MLATITFQAVAAGTSPLTFAPPNATNLGGIPFTSINGSVTVDSATTNVRVVPAVKNVTVGDTFAVDVVADYVLNSGSFQFKLAFDPASWHTRAWSAAAIWARHGDSAHDRGRFRQLRPDLDGRQRPDRRAEDLGDHHVPGARPWGQRLDPLGCDPDDGQRLPQPSVAVDGQVNISPLPGAQFSVVPAAQTVTIGDDVYVKIHIDGAADLGAFEFKLAYQSSQPFVHRDQRPHGRLPAQHGPQRLPDEQSGAGRCFIRPVQHRGRARTERRGRPGDATLPGDRRRHLALALSNQIATTTQGFVQPSSALSGQVTVNSLPRASVYLQPAAESHQIGDTFVVDVMVNGAVDLGAFQFDLAYDKNILKYVSLVGAR